MNYIGNDRYKIEINGQEIIVSADELKEAYIEIKNFEKSPTNDYIETCPQSYIFEDSAQFELLRTEIKDSGFKNIEWSSELNEIMMLSVESAMKTAHKWYTSKYHMEPKF
jgi:hypothetical protein